MKKPYKQMPVVYFDHYVLRTLKKTDYKDMYDYGKNPEVTRYLSWGPFIIPSEAKRSILQIFYPRVRYGLPIGYAIVDVKTSKMIGTIDFHSKIKGENGAEIGYVLHQNYWNKGIMSQAIKKMIEIGFEYLNFDILRIRHLKKNIASQKVIEKTPFKFIQKEKYVLEKRNSVLEDEMLTYELSKEDYYGSKQS
ncbi:MAG: GNAT family N-acetyltransferase [Tenericutes bacterium]|jgi:[ribosomal protein S5]-alanine N-acetyltransferase|nr:GNAT family N-acetyltransferase [Mycoplasmatota bacterium]